MDCYLIIEQILERRFPMAHKLPAWLRHPYQLLRIALTFALTCFAWIFFRRTSTEAFYIVSHVGSGSAVLLSGTCRTLPSSRYLFL